MGADRLDAQLEPLAQLLLLIILLIVVAALATYILIRSAARRREARHHKLSASKRMKHTGINLLPRSESGEDMPRPDRSKRRRRRGSRDHLRIDILRRPEERGGEQEMDPSVPEPPSR